jgi:AraC-like DNA-binding protein
MALRESQPGVLAEDAIGVVVRSRGFVVAVTSSGLLATLAWGAYDVEEAGRLAEAWGHSLSGPRRDTLVDITGITAVDARTFDVLRALLENRREDRARAVSAQAIVSGNDFGGTVVMGYLKTFPPPYPLESFAARRDALAWLGHAGDAEELEGVDAARDGLLARLREWLEGANLDDRQMDVAARFLGVTPRTLQRRLAVEGTRYSVEVARAQIARAQRLMGEPGRKLSDIALEVGCSTPSSFCDLFRRVTGLTATEWRRRVARAS